MNHAWLLVAAAVLMIAAIVVNVLSQRLRHGSALRFWLEKILSRSLSLAAIMMLLIYAFKSFV